MSISFIHFGPSDLFMMVSFMYSLNLSVDVIFQILLPIIWILPLITWASTLKIASMWLYRPSLQVFTFSHWSHSSSSGCQASNHSSNRFFLGMSMLLFKFSTTRVNYSPLPLHFSPLASVQLFFFQKFTYLYWSRWSAYSVLESVEAWGCDQGCSLWFPCDQRQCALSNSSSKDLHTAIHHTGKRCPSLYPLKTQWRGGSFPAKNVLFFSFKICCKDSS